MENPKISVLISTRNRPRQLTECLKSLCEQSQKPFEVIIVDNGTSLQTKNMCLSFINRLSITYLIEKRIGLPFGRNSGIERAKGNICAFIDDDCIADKHWLIMIEKHFRRYLSVGVIGLTKPIDPLNIPSCVEDIYYHRWMLQHIPSIDTNCKLKSGAIIDFRNAAFLSKFIKKFKFNEKLLTSCEDVEMGIRLYASSSNIYFNPAIKVLHNNSSTYKKLFIRNFLTGYATQELLSKFDIKIEQIRNPFKISVREKSLIKTFSFSELGKNFIYNVIFQIYPWFSRLGRLTFIYKNMGKRIKQI